MKSGFYVWQRLGNRSVTADIYILHSKGVALSINTERTFPKHKMYAQRKESVSDRIYGLTGEGLLLLKIDWLFVTSIWFWWHRKGMGIFLLGGVSAHVEKRNPFLLSVQLDSKATGTWPPEVTPRTKMPYVKTAESQSPPMGTHSVWLSSQYLSQKAIVPRDGKAAWVITCGPSAYESCL